MSIMWLISLENERCKNVRIFLNYVDWDIIILQYVGRIQIDNLFMHVL